MSTAFHSACANGTEKLNIKAVQEHGWVGGIGVLPDGAPRKFDHQQIVESLAIDCDFASPRPVVTTHYIAIHNSALSADQRCTACYNELQVLAGKHLDQQPISDFLRFADG
jgi:hypothetical protein